MDKPTEALLKRISASVEKWANVTRRYGLVFERRRQRVSAVADDALDRYRTNRCKITRCSGE